MKHWRIPAGLAIVISGWAVAVSGGDPLQSAIVSAITSFLGWAVFWTNPPELPRAARGARRTPVTQSAYLVLMLDTRQAPPVAERACIFSGPASRLTTLNGAIGLDLHRYEDETLKLAREGLITQSMMYYPWVIPLLRKGGEIP